ncbi:MAG TPA: RodZ domain-containing protein [bacterium]|nr:RodZ domain-containing protein [bacterium]
MRELGIGDRLRNAREAKGLSLDAVEGLTRIRAAYLEALEDEQFERLPGLVYGRGFLRTYAAALGLDPDPLLEVFPTEPPGMQPIIGVHGVEVPIQPAAPRSPLRRAATFGGLILLAGLLVVGAVGYFQLREFSAPLPPEAVTPPPPAPPSAEPILPPPAIPEPPVGDAKDQREPPPVGGVNVELRATGPSWVRVVADGESAFQGILEAGDVRRWHAERRLTIRVGNSHAVEVRVNGEAFEPPPRRQVWEETFEAPNDAR